MAVRARRRSRRMTTPFRCIQRLSPTRRVFFFNDPAPTEIYTGWYTLSLHDALPICCSTSTTTSANSSPSWIPAVSSPWPRSEEHTSELQSHHPISYAVFCLKKKKLTIPNYESLLQSNYKKQ